MYTGKREDNIKDEECVEEKEYIRNDTQNININIYTEKKSTSDLYIYILRGKFSVRIWHFVEIGEREKKGMRTIRRERRRALRPKARDADHTFRFTSC